MAAFVAAPLAGAPFGSVWPTPAGASGPAGRPTLRRSAGYTCGRLRRAFFLHPQRSGGVLLCSTPVAPAGSTPDAVAASGAAAVAAALAAGAAPSGSKAATTAGNGGDTGLVLPDSDILQPRLGLGGGTPGREDEFISSIGTSKSQSVTTLEKESTERSFGTVLQELAAIQADGPRNVAILGTRHASYLHQQIIELLTYANVLVGNHVFTSGAAGTNYAVIKGALRAEKPDLLTVVLPQSMRRQPAESQTQLKKVKHVVELSKNDSLPLDYASQLCNSDILSRCTHFIAFAFHDSDVILESAREAKALGKVATLMFLD
eukprot:TRINITY_DN2295_c0_g1_i5.p1 TRINITY_DN2295_c0_g1~~TRINITY_DN2295_c0_g1_i5.p1  ORF type:complete len:356 (-),score=94.29 TRINITY_DN2295_c0_g1_i5:158-1111(-)